MKPRSAPLRSAPSGGYDFENKSIYRQRIWEIFKLWQKNDRFAAHALFMPSSEGLEIETARQAGYQYRRMHVVDSNPAIVAHLKRRWPEVLTYGVTVDRAVERCILNGVNLDVLHLDYCGNVGLNVLSSLMNIASCLPNERCPLIAVNILRGRELTPITDTHEYFLKKGTSTVPPEFLDGSLFADFVGYDRLRFMLILSALEGREIDGLTPRFIPFPIAHGRYRSSAGTQTFLWSVFSLQGWKQSRQDLKFTKKQDRTLIKLARETVRSNKEHQ